MKKLFVILMLCLSQSGCLAVAVVEGVTDVAIAVVTAPIKVGTAVVDAVSGEDDDEDSGDLEQQNYCLKLAYKKWHPEVPFLFYITCFY